MDGLVTFVSSFESFFAIFGVLYGCFFHILSRRDVKQARELARAAREEAAAAEARAAAAEVRADARVEAAEVRADARVEVAEARAKLESRKSFLSGIICDHKVSLKTRQIFYDEYISLGGNGTVQQAWLSFQDPE